MTPAQRFADLRPNLASALLALARKQHGTATDLKTPGILMSELVRKGLAEADRCVYATFYTLSEQGQEVIDFLRSQPLPVEGEQPIARIQRVVAAHFGIPLIEMVSARRSREVARPRQVAMYFAKRLTPKSLPDIGRRFGNRDHTTVLHAIRQVERLIAEDCEIASAVETLRHELSPEMQVAA